MAKILSKRGYRHTKETVESMEFALQDYRQRAPQESTLTPVMQQLTMDGMQSLIDEWRQEMRDFEALLCGERRVEVRSLDDVPAALILGRLAAGLTQKQLAQRLGLSAGQVSRYETTRYRTVRLGRILEVAHALQLVPNTLPGKRD